MILLPTSLEWKAFLLEENITFCFTLQLSGVLTVHFALHPYQVISRRSACFLLSLSVYSKSYTMKRGS